MGNPDGQRSCEARRGRSGKEETVEKRFYDWQKDEIVSASKQHAKLRDAARDSGCEEMRQWHAGYLGGLYEALRILGFSRKFAEDGSLEGFE